MKKFLTAGLAAALATTMCVSFADGDDDDDKDYKYRGEGFLRTLEPSVDQLETIVISLATNPREEPEAACVALQIAMNLLMEDVNGDDPGGEVTPADSVQLFATLDGVYLVAPDSDFSTTMCLTPDPDKPYKPLSKLLEKFVDEMEGEVLVCPLCWLERLYEGQAPTYGTVANGVGIHNLFLYGDKILTF